VEFIRSIVHGTDGRAQKAAANLPHMTPVRSAGRAPHLAVSLRDRDDMNICGNVAAHLVVSQYNQRYVQSFCSRLGAAIVCWLRDAPIALAGKEPRLNHPRTAQPQQSTVLLTTVLLSRAACLAQRTVQLLETLKMCKKVQRPRPVPAEPWRCTGYCRAKRSDLVRSSFANKPARCTRITPVHSARTDRRPTSIPFLQSFEPKRAIDRCAEYPRKNPR
jgi:hypothetical protein